MAKIDLDAILALEEKAEPAPWNPEESWGEWPNPGNICGDNCMDPANSFLVSAMRNNIRSLCLELEAARKVIEEVKIRHPGEDNRLAWSVKKYDEVTNGNS